MKRSLLAWGFLALGMTASQAWAQSADWRQTGMLDRPVPTEEKTADVRDNFGLPAPRAASATAELGQPNATDPQPAKSATLPERLPESAPPSIPTTTASCDQGCNSNKNCGFFIGAGIYFARPVFSSNPAFVSSVTQTTTDPNTTVTTTQDFNWNYQASPKAWIGYVADCGWGVQFSFWHFQSDPATLILEHPADQPGVQTFGSTLGALPIPVRSNFPPIPADVIHIDSSLLLDTYDMEVIWIGGYERGYTKFGAGARYAYLRQNYFASLINTGNPPNFFQSEQNQFAGAGPTVSGEVGCRVWRRFGLYGNGRFSLLFGESSQYATQSQTGVTPGLNFTSNNQKMVTIPVGEIELGVNWIADWNRCRFIVKTGFAAQMWWDAGSASIPPGGNFSSLGSQSPQGVFFPVSTATNSNLGFLGWTFSMGINY